MVHSRTPSVNDDWPMAGSHVEMAPMSPTTAQTSSGDRLI
jgi:hypothetical protein